MSYAAYAEHVKLNRRVREIKPLLADASELRQVALHYASQQLTQLLLGHRIRRRWALGPERTLRVLDYVTRVSFSDAVTTAEVNFLRDCDVRLAPSFYTNFIITAEDLLGVLLHERNHPLIVSLIYPPLAPFYLPQLPHNVIDDTLDNALVRSVCFTDVFERYYLGAPDGVTPPTTDDLGTWELPASRAPFSRWYWPLLTYRNDLAVATINELIDKHTVVDDSKHSHLQRMLAVHWGIYESFRRRLTQHLATRNAHDSRHPLHARLLAMLQDSQRTATPAGLSTAEWAELRVKVAEHTPLQSLSLLRKGFAVIEDVRKRESERRAGVDADKKTRANDPQLRPDPATPLLGDTQPFNGGAAKVGGVARDTKLPEWTDDDNNLVRLARELLPDLRDYAPRFHTDATYLEPLDRYQQTLVGTLAQHINEGSYASELWESRSLPYLPAHMSRRDLLTLSAGHEPLDYSTREPVGAPPARYHLIADVSGSMSHYLPLLPPFIRAVREQLEAQALEFSGLQHLVSLEELTQQVLTDHQTKFMPVWQRIVDADWARVLVLTDDETSEKDVNEFLAYHTLRTRIRAQQVVLCLIRVGEIEGPWTALLRDDHGQALGPPHFTVVLSPDAAQTAA
jgi:hypothetical protein